ncbi:cyclin-L1 isoform X1 [Patella vulgata]|uniref:cyclin-L1 isoform X1 n=2 Tax=Patella vulgata TaxID=6465 RepID=UPI00217F60D7|nr:cyclin-L1 isoform X1 [Patella vulgata]
MAETPVDPLSVKDFSKVILTLDNVLIPPEKLSTTPSMQDGLDLDTEIDLRFLGCELIQTAGILLKLPQVAMATGQVIFQRFYYSKSFVKHNMEVVAMACTNLASKIEECPRRIRDVVNVFHHVKQVRSGRTIHPLILDQNYINLKNQVIKGERRILKELGFCVHVKHPHKIIVMFLQVLECQQNKRLVQCAWNYMNDSFRTDVFVRYHPETIACACIYLAARQLQIALPINPSWFGLFQVDEEEIQQICLTLLYLYSRKKPNYEELERVVDKAKKLQVEAKLKAKGLTSDYGTPNSQSRQNSPKNVSPSVNIIPGMKRVRMEDEPHSDSDKNHRNGKKRHRSDSEGTDSPRHRSRSRSRSSSNSFTRSPRRKNKSPRKLKKERRSPSHHYHKDKHTHKKKRHVVSRSRSRSFSPSPDRYKAKRYHKEKARYGYSPDRYSRKQRNGHRSPTRDRYDKYRR